MKYILYTFPVPDPFPEEHKSNLRGLLDNYEKGIAPINLVGGYDYPYQLDTFNEIKELCFQKRARLLISIIPSDFTRFGEHILLLSRSPLKHTFVEEEPLTAAGLYERLRQKHVAFLESQARIAKKYQSKLTTSYGDESRKPRDQEKIDIARSHPDTRAAMGFIMANGGLDTGDFKMARLLNEAGMKTRNDTKFYPETVKRIKTYMIDGQESPDGV